MTPTDLETLRGLVPISQEYDKDRHTFGGISIAMSDKLASAAHDAIPALTALLADYERRGELLKEILPLMDALDLEHLSEKVYAEIGNKIRAIL